MTNGWQVVARTPEGEIIMAPPRRPGVERSAQLADESLEKRRTRKLAARQSTQAPPGATNGG